MAWPRIIRSVRERGTLRDLAAWLFLGTLVVAPWLYGGTTSGSIEIINGMLGVAFVLWAASLLLDRRWPDAPRGLLIISGLILLQGWWMVANAHSIYDSTYRFFVPVRAIFRNGPGSVDYALSLAWMLRATALLAVVCFTAELTQRPVWLLRLWSAIALAGGSIALLGLIQKGTGAHMIFWQLAAPSDTTTFFASYYYHANAGAFLNLVLPLVAGLVLWATLRQASPWARAACLTALVLLVVAALSNTSRMAQAVGAMLVVAMIAAVARPALQMIARVEKRTLLVALFVVILTVLAVAQAVHLDQPLRRWQSLSEQFPADARWLANRAAVPAAGDAGWFGFGPGTFRAIFPHYQKRIANLDGAWRFLHDDYLQTILEWGWLGSAAIAVLFFGGIGMGVRSFFKRRDWSNRQRILVGAAVLALIGVALHALVDFPLQIMSIQLFVATYLGICWGSGEGGGQRTEAGGQRPERRWGAGRSQDMGYDGWQIESIIGRDGIESGDGRILNGLRSGRLCGRRPESTHFPAQPASPWALFIGSGLWYRGGLPTHGRPLASRFRNVPVAGRKIVSA